MNIRRVWASLLVSSVFLAACSSGKGDGSGSTATKDKASARGGELTIVRTADIDGWDPDSAKLVATYVTIPNVLEGLVRVAKDGVTIEPALAQSWTFDAAGPSYTFTLRKGLKFSDGTPLTAKDVAFSATEWVKGKRLGVFYADIKAATAVDDSTVKFTLAKPSTFLLDIMASGTAPVVPKDYEGKTREAFYKAPIGAGPYTIQTYTPGVKTVLVKNAAYNDPAAVKVEKVTYKVVADPSQQLAQFKSGEADIIESLDPSLAQQVDQDKQQVVNPGSRIADVVFNWNSPLGKDVNFRKAVNLALDRDQLVKVAYNGLATPATGIIPRGTIGSVGCGCDAYRHDVDGAKAALKASSYKGEKLHLVTGVTSGDSPQIELIRADLKAAGIDVTVEQLDIQVLIQRVGEGKFDIGVGSYGNVSPTAGDVFFYMFATKFFGTGAPVDQVLANFGKFATAADEKAKGDAVRGLETWAAETLPIVPIVSTALVVPVNKRVHGLQVRPYSRYYLDELSVG